jgi:uncharacterized membrane protein HdeD (DUF308 family)
LSRPRPAATPSENSWALVGGLVEFFAGLASGETAGTRALFIVSGLVSVAFGVLLFARPGVGAQNRVVVIGQRVRECCPTLA